MIHQTITLSFEQRQVPVYIGQHIFHDKTLLATHIHGPRVLIVTQQNIALHHLEKLLAALTHVQCDVVYLPAGEEHKQLSAWQHILDNLLQKQHDRTTTLIAFGGGIVGDVTGFAAACYQRGIHYLQIPTTLIAQVDAAIGGKTAVNHPLGKNMIGVVYQPQCVIADIDLLKTLPPREFAAGLAEVIKHGMAFDSEFFCWLEQNTTALLAQDPAALLHAVWMSVKIKGEIVTQDEYDNGLRHLLNFGHTFGHALETAGSYQKLLHGEAVALGMVLATRLSTQLGILASPLEERLTNLLQRFDLPVQIALPELKELMAIMSLDKKVRAGKLHFILLSALGVAIKSAAIGVTEWETLLTREFFSA
jgi:3-dehydroquinate synthase